MLNSNYHNVPNSKIDAGVQVLLGGDGEEVAGEVGGKQGLVELLVKTQWTPWTRLLMWK